MGRNHTRNATPQFRLLSDDQIEQIIDGALRLLEETGTVVHAEEALALLAKAGAKVDGKRVRIPADLARKMVACVPPRIDVGDRSGKPAMVLEGHRIHYGTGSDCPFIMDAESGERRRFTKKDIEDAARVVDACPNLDFLMSLGLMSDVPAYSYDRHQAAAMLRHTTKPLVLTAMSRDGLADILDMYTLLRGGREAFEANPGFVVYIEPTTPLIHSKASMEKVLLSAERRIPAIYTPCPMAGATAPVTLAGALLLSVAEFVAGATVSQLKQRGAPLVMGGVASSLDMQSTILTYGSPELHLMSAGLTDIAHFLKIPMFSTAGCSDSKTLDEQAASEAALSILAAGLSGANLIHDVGFLESALIGSHEMVVMSDEIIGMARHFFAGIRIDEETLARAVIDEVGPGGNFLTHEHTVKHFRDEFWFPRLMDRNRYGTWKAAGGETMGDRVRKRVKDILASHTVPPLDRDVEAGIDRILKNADRKAGAADTSLV